MRSLVVLLGLLPFHIFAQSVPASISKDTAEQQIRYVEQQRFTAMVKKDFAMLEPMLAEELVYTHSNGGTETKREFLAAMRSGKMTYIAIEPEQSQIRIYQNIALINGIAKLQVNSGANAQSVRVRYTDAYVLRNGKWQLVTWQSTRITE